jgi:hypothetical protein
MAGSAVQTLVLIFEQFVTKVGDDDGKFAQMLADLKATLGTEETEIEGVAARVATLESAAPVDLSAILSRLDADEASIKALQDAPPVPVDLTALTTRVQALEDRNAADDAAAGTLNPPPPPPPVLGLSPTTLADAEVGQPYSATITASGGVSPYAFSIASGSLPDGLSMAPGGLISGTPTAAGTSSVSIQAHDANNVLVSADYTVVVDPIPAPVPITVEPTAVSGTSGTPITGAFSASGGSAPFTFAIDVTPDGVSVAEDGTVSGTPTTGGGTTSIVTATDSTGATGSATVSWSIG